MVEHEGNDLPPSVFETAVENAPDPVTITDRDGTIVYTNERGAGTLGYAPEELVGQHWTMLYDDDEADRLAAEFAAPVDESGVWHGEAVARAKDGERVPVSVSVAIADDGYVVSLARDITDRKQYEWELERKNERLEEFASVVAHDIRNPLSVALGNVELARETADDDHLDTAADALDRMEALVDDLLALSREGETVGDTEPIALSAAAERAWEGVDSPDASLVVDSEMSLDADEPRLVRLLQNLFQNAVEHGPAGSRTSAGGAVEQGAGDTASDERVTVAVGALGSGGDDSQRGFYVADDGPGIPDEQRDRIFEFGHSTGEGTGLGLAIVGRIAAAHGWSVSVTDSETGGARFEFHVGPRVAAPSTER